MNSRNVFHQAIEDMALLPRLKIAAFMAEQIALAHKFIVPEAGKMTDGKPFDEFKEAMKLPYERIALLREIELDGKEHPQICVAVDAEIAGFESPVDFAVVDCMKNAKGQWGPSAPVGVQMTRIGGGVQLFYKPDARREEVALYGGPLHVGDGFGALNGLTELMVMLSLANVKTKRVAADVALNRKRSRNGRLPLYDFHVLTIDGHEVYDRDGSEATDRTVRSHFRRGHIRRLDEQRRVWVRASYVHGARSGFVDKDYRVQVEL